MVKKNDPWARIAAINKKLVRDNRKSSNFQASPTKVSNDNNGLDGSYYLEH